MISSNRYHTVRLGFPFCASVYVVCHGFVAIFRTRSAICWRSSKRGSSPPSRSRRTNTSDVIVGRGLVGLVGCVGGGGNGWEGDGHAADVGEGDWWGWGWLMLVWRANGGGGGGLMGVEGIYGLGGGDWWGGDWWGLIGAGGWGGEGTDGVGNGFDGVEGLWGRVWD